MKYTQVTGQSTDVFDLLDQFKTFIENNAVTEWTVNGYTDVNAGLPRRGKHLSISNSRGLYFNFNSTDYRYLYHETNTNELTGNTTYKQYPSLTCTPSRGYDANEAWWQQPGYFSSMDSTGRFGGSVIHDDAVTNNHRFMISDDKKLIIIINEFNNRFFFTIFGDVNQNWVDTTEGFFLYASHMPARSNTYANGLYVDEDRTGTDWLNFATWFATNGFLFENLDLRGGSGYPPFMALTFNHDGTLYEDNRTFCSLYDGTSAGEEFPKWDKKNFGDKYSYNTYNENSILFPIEFYVDTSGSTAYTEIRKAADLSGIYAVNMVDFDINEVLTIGLDNYLIIPFYKKESPQRYDFPKSHGFGLAIAIN